MILKKEFNILKKPYLTPRIEFEEIEADEREMLMVSNNSTSTGSPGSEEGVGKGFSLGAEFESMSSSSNTDDDFLINDF